MTETYTQTNEFNTENFKIYNSNQRYAGKNSDGSSKFEKLDYQKVVIKHSSLKFPKQLNLSKDEALELKQILNSLEFNIVLENSGNPTPKTITKLTPIKK